MGIVYADVRLSNFSRPELEELSVNALVDAGALDLVIPEHLAIQLNLADLRPREVRLADGSHKLVRYVGPLKVEAMGRDCVTGAVVMGDQVLLGAVAMQLNALTMSEIRAGRRSNSPSPNARVTSRLRPST